MLVQIESVTTKALFFVSASRLLIKLAKIRSSTPTAVDDKEKMLSEALVRLIAKWKEYLKWLSHALLLVKTMISTENSSPQTLQSILTVATSLVTLLNVTQNALNLLVLLKLFLSKVARVTLNKWAIPLWAVLIYFSFNQLAGLWPKVQERTSQLFKVVKFLPMVTNGPLREYALGMVDELKEGNPDLHKFIHESLKKIDQIMFIQTFFQEQLGALQPILLNPFVMTFYQTLQRTFEAALAGMTRSTALEALQQHGAEDLLGSVRDYQLHSKNGSVGTMNKL